MRVLRNAECANGDTVRLGILLPVGALYPADGVDVCRGDMLNDPSAVVSLCLVPFSKLPALFEPGDSLPSGEILTL